MASGEECEERLLTRVYIQDDIAAAEPSIDERTEQMVVKGRFLVPGYKVCRARRLFEETRIETCTDGLFSPFFTGEIR